MISSLENGTISEKDLNIMLKDGEITQDVYDQIIQAYEAADKDAMENGNPDEAAANPVTTSAEAPEEDPKRWWTRQVLRVWIQMLKE